MPLGFPAQVGLAAYEAVRVSSENTRQNDVGAARMAFDAGGTFAAYDAAIKASDIAHHTRLVSGARANGINASGSLLALRRSGVDVV